MLSEADLDDVMSGYIVGYETDLQYQKHIQPGGWVAGYAGIVRYHSHLDAVVVQFASTSSGQLFWLDLERVYERVVRVLERSSL